MGLLLPPLSLGQYSPLPPCKPPATGFSIVIKVQSDRAPMTHGISLFFTLSLPSRPLSPSLSAPPNFPPRLPLSDSQPNLRATLPPRSSMSAGKHTHTGMLSLLLPGPEFTDTPIIPVYRLSLSQRCTRPSRARARRRLACCKQHCGHLVYLGSEGGSCLSLPGRKSEGGTCRRDGATCTVPHDSLPRAV
jgi:hypothetical protein